MYTMSAKMASLDKNLCKEIDQSEGRVRLNGEGLEAMIVFLSMRLLLRKATESLKPFLAKTKAARMIWAVLGLLDKLADDMLNHVSVAQLKTIYANTNEIVVSLSCGKMNSYANISYEHMHALASKALESCELLCTRTREESKDCPMRKAMDHVPGICHRKLTKDPTQCPYAGAAFDVEDV